MFSKDCSQISGLRYRRSSRITSSNKSSKLNVDSVIYSRPVRYTRYENCVNNGYSTSTNGISSRDVTAFRNAPQCETEEEQTSSDCTCGEYETTQQEHVRFAFNKETTCDNCTCTKDDVDHENLHFTVAGSNDSGVDCLHCLHVRGETARSSGTKRQKDPGKSVEKCVSCEKNHNVKKENVNLVVSYLALLVTQLLLIDHVFNRALKLSTCRTVIATPRIVYKYMLHLKGPFLIGNQALTTVSLVV